MFKVGIRSPCTKNLKSCPSTQKNTTQTHRWFRSYSTSNEQWRRAFDEYSKRNNINLHHGWYQVDVSAVDETTSKIIKKHFKGSLYKALSTVYPDTDWHAWKFVHQPVPRGYWIDETNHRKFFDDLGQKLGIQTLDDWYEKFSAKIILQNGGRALLSYHDEAPLTALMAAYPQHNWIPWKFNTVPKGHWTDVENQKKFFDDLGKKLGVQTLDDWYQKLSSDAIAKHGGNGLLFKYNHSPLAALEASYPEHNWVPWNFKAVPFGFWTQRENQLEFFDELGKKLGIKTRDDWYQKLSYKTIADNGGVSMLRLFNGSPTAALMAVYPEHNWILWKFKSVPTRFWKDVANKKMFFDSLGKKIGIQTLDDWYERVSVESIIEHGGIGLLMRHNKSPAAAVMASYPEHNWVVWKFKREPLWIWNSKENVSKFLAELSEKLSIQTLDDWYRVDKVQLQQFGAATLLSKYRGLYGLLKEQYPHHPWDRRRFQQRTGKKAQRWLAVTLKKMFPDEEILEDYAHPKVTFPASNRSVQLDVFIPSKNLAFEYQGEQHYEEVGVFSPTKTYQQRDEEKRTLCASNNIKLIEVPYWWNRTQESLQEMIATQ